MKKKLLSLAVALFSVVAGWAQTSPYTGVAPGEIVSGTSYYLYNVDFGTWLGDNDRNTGYGWTSHAEIGAKGFDIEFITNGDGWQLNPKMGNNHSINKDNLYMDTNAEVSLWTIEAIADGASNAVKIKCGTDRGLAVNNGGDMDERNDNGNNHNNWQIITRKERLDVLTASATLQNPAKLDWIIQNNNFPVADERNSSWVYSGTYGNKNPSNGDGKVHCNRALEAWTIESYEMKQTITGLPNGLYRVNANACYSQTGNGGINLEGYNAYKNGTEPCKGVIFAGDATIPMVDVYEAAKASNENGCFSKKLAEGVYVSDGIDQFSAAMFYGNYKTKYVYAQVTDGTLDLGARVSGANAAWIVVDNFNLEYLGDVNLSELQGKLDEAISDAEEFTGNTTDAIAQRLANALSAARTLVGSDNIGEISPATDELNNALSLAKAANTAVLRPTVALAKAEGINVATQEDYLENGTTNRVEELLRLTRNLRKLNAIEKVDITKIECSEPTNVEADYYLYNVGAGVFFSTTSDWGCHIAIDNPGMLIHFRPDGEWGGAAGRPVFHLSGNGWDGMNWGEEYWDKNGENKLAFVPVEGKDKVYNMCEWDNYNWHFVYDPADDVCDQETHYWNTVQKRDWNRNDYKDNPYAQWMLVSPEAYKAAMKKTDADSKLDVTFLIENPNFTKVNGGNWTRGWTGVGGEMRGQDREPWMVIEWFEKSANMTQNLHNVPAGKYEVSCYGFYRDGNSDNEANKVKNGDALRQDAFLVANGERVALPNVTSAAGMMPGIGESHGLDADFACWPWQANEYFQTGLYKATVPVEVGADGELTIGIEYNHTTGADGSWVVVGNFRLTSLGAADVATVTEAGYATYVAPFDIKEIPAGVDAYAAQDKGSYIHLEQVNAIPAGEAVVLKNEGSYTFYSTSSNVELGADNDLVAATEDVTANGTQYILGKKNDVVGFYKATSGSTIKAGKAYLVSSNSINALYFDEDEETAINNVNANVNENQSIYNLAGQRIMKMQRGVNIVNGNKVLK